MAAAYTDELGINFRNSALFRCAQSEQSLVFLHVLGIKSIELSKLQPSFQQNEDRCVARSALRSSAIGSIPSVSTRVNQTRVSNPVRIPRTRILASASRFAVMNQSVPASHSEIFSTIPFVPNFGKLQQATAPPISSDDESVHTQPAVQTGCSALHSPREASKINDDAKLLADQQRTEQQLREMHLRILASMQGATIVKSQK